MGWSDTRWTAEIAEITTSTEYQNATVSIVDPSLLDESWDIDTNTPTFSGNWLIAQGISARINWPLRAITDPGTKDADPSVVRAGRMSIPWSEYSGPLRTGLNVFVTDGGDNVDLTRFVLRIDEAINSSNVAARVMKVSVNGEASESPVVPLLGSSGYGDPDPSPIGYGN